jgi:micrococcal nuclease
MIFSDIFKSNDPLNQIFDHNYEDSNEQSNKKIDNKDDNNQNKIIENIELEGIVTYVVDGDTLDINDIRIPLSLADTPERGQNEYKEAKDFVKDICLDKKGEVDIDDGQRRGDRYGTEVGIVYCDGINLNSVLMENNLARIYTDYCDISEFRNEEWSKPYC